MIADNNFAAVTLAQIMDTQDTPDELSIVHDEPNEELCPNEYSTTQKSPEMHDNENSLTHEKSNESPEDFRRTSKIDVSGAFKWPHDAVLLLIEEYRIRAEDFSSGKVSQKKTWEEISDELNKKDYNTTGPQCLSKFSGLKRTYKSIKYHNNKSGNGLKTWPYFNLMDSLIGSKLYMNPVATVSSTGKRQSSSNDDNSFMPTVNNELPN